MNVFFLILGCVLLGSTFGAGVGAGVCLVALAVSGHIADSLKKREP